MPSPRDQWASRRLEDIVDGILYVGPKQTTSGISPQLCADPGYVTGAGARRADTGGDSLMRKEPGPARCRSTADGGFGGVFIAERRPLRAIGPFARNTPRPRRWRLPPTGVDCSASSRGRAVPRSPSPPSRLLFAMGENDQLPAVFVATHPRFRTPMLAIGPHRGDHPCARALQHLHLGAHTASAKSPGPFNAVQRSSTSRPHRHPHQLPPRAEDRSCRCVPGDVIGKPWFQRDNPLQFEALDSEERVSADAPGRRREGCANAAKPTRRPSSPSGLADEAESRARRVGGNQDPLARGNLMRPHEHTTSVGFDSSLRAASNGRHAEVEQPRCRLTFVLALHDRASRWPWWSMKQ